MPLLNATSASMATKFQWLQLATDRINQRITNQLNKCMETMIKTTSLSAGRQIYDAEPATNSTKTH